MSTNDVVYLCPECGSPSIDHAELVGSTASCRSCGWGGSASELLGSQFSHQFSNRDEIVQRMVGDLRNVIAKSAAASLGGFLLRWGFLDQPIQPSQLGRYLAAMGRGMVTAVFEEREKMLEEKSGRPKS